jgi:hypothetical protein
LLYTTTSVDCADKDQADLIRRVGGEQVAAPGDFDAGFVLGEDADNGGWDSLGVGRSGASERGQKQDDERQESLEKGCGVRDPEGGFD